jgi:hypothetical protein
VLPNLFREQNVSDTKVIRIEKHHYHHHRRPPARTVYVPQVRTERVTEACHRPHRGVLGTTLMALGGIVLFGALMASRD